MKTHIYDSETRVVHQLEIINNGDRSFTFTVIDENKHIIGKAAITMPELAQWLNQTRRAKINATWLEAVKNTKKTTPPSQANEVLAATAGQIQTTDLVDAPSDFEAFHKGFDFVNNVYKAVI